jgi:hypothetical protein
MTMYQYKANTYARPFFSETYSGFVEENDPMTALRMTVGPTGDDEEGYYSVAIYECTPANKCLARYLSSKAATSVDAGCGVHRWEGDSLFVDDKLADVKPERFEELP